MFKQTLSFGFLQLYIVHQGKNMEIGDLPREIHVKILWCLRNDSLTMHRVEAVCTLWAEIVRYFEIYRSLQFRATKILKRLRKTESYNESAGIMSSVNPSKFKGSPLLAERAEKVFLTHMEIIRLKYPISLHRLQSANAVRLIVSFVKRLKRPFLSPFT